MNSNWLPPNSAQPSRPLELPDFLALLSEPLQLAAVDLRPWHVAEAGLPPAAALAAIRELVAACWAVLGGELWELEQGAWHFGGEQWGVNRRGKNEDWPAYVERAGSVAEDRVRSLKERGEAPKAIWALQAVSEERYQELLDSNVRPGG